MVLTKLLTHALGVKLESVLLDVYESYVIIKRLGACWREDKISQVSMSCKSG